MNKTTRLDRAERELHARGKSGNRFLSAYDLATHWQIPADVRARCVALAQAGARDAIRDELRRAMPAWFAKPTGRGKWSTALTTDAVRLPDGAYLLLDPALEPTTDEDVFDLLVYVAMTPRGADVLAASRRD